MANNNNSSTSAGNALRKAKRMYQESVRQEQINCPHRDKHGAVLDDPSKQDLYFIDNRQLDEGDMICTECRELMNLRSVTQEEARAYFAGIRNMVNQLKVFYPDIPQDQYDALIGILETCDKMERTLIPFYVEVIIKGVVKGGKKKGGNNQQRSKGKIGPQVGSFNKR